MPVFAFYTHLDRAETPIASFAGKHIIFCRPASNLLKASISSFDSVRERALPRGSSRVVCIAASAQFVSLLLVFLRPRLVFLVACYFDEVVFRGFLSIPRILTELRSEKFEWFGPSPIEPFNSGDFRVDCFPAEARG